MKNLKKILFALILLFLVSPTITSAQTSTNFIDTQVPPATFDAPTPPTTFEATTTPSTTTTGAIDSNDPFYLNHLSKLLVLGSTNPIIIVAKLINIALGLIGVIFVLIVLSSGFQWMLSGGDVDKIVAARKTLINGIIGLFLILASYAIAQFVINTFSASTNTGTPQENINQTS